MVLGNAELLTMWYYKRRTKQVLYFWFSQTVQNEVYMSTLFYRFLYGDNTYLYHSKYNEQKTGAMRSQDENQKYAD